MATTLNHAENQTTTYTMLVIFTVHPSSDEHLQDGQAIRCTRTEPRTFLAEHLDWGILERLRSAIESGKPTQRFRLPILSQP